MSRATVLISSFAILAILAAPAADAARTSRHSGTVVTVNPGEGVLVLDEIGPWRVERGQTVSIRRTIAFTADTKFNTFIRVDVPGRFARDFIEVDLDAGDVSPGDFVTAECDRVGGGLVARVVTVAELDELRDGP